MKKLLLTLGLAAATLFGSLPSYAYEVTFKTNTSDASNQLTTSNFNNQIATGSEYITFKSCSKVFQGKSGLKFSSSSAAGTLTLDMTEVGQIKASAITIATEAYNTDQTTWSIAVNGGTKTDLEKGVFTYTLPEPTVITSITLSSTKRAYLKSFSVIDAVSATAPDAPTITDVNSIIAGTYYFFAEELVELSSDVTGAEIFYTLDGTNPNVTITDGVAAAGNEATKKYTEELTLTDDADLVAVAVADGEVGEAAKRSYVRILPAVTPEAGTITVEDKITISLPIDMPTGKEAYICYTTDGTTPTLASELYTEPFTISKTGETTLKVIAFYEANENDASKMAEVKYNVTKVKENVTLAFAETEANVVDGDTYKVTAPTCSLEGAEITYTFVAEPEGCATFDEAAMEITAVNPGKATLTATFAGNDDYNSAEDTFTLTITKTVDNTPYQLVTSATELTNGASIIIVGNDGTYYYTLGDQQPNNFKQTSALTMTGNSATLVDGAQVLTLVKLNEQRDNADLYAFKTEDGKYLYAASSTSNYLRTQDTLDDAAKATISFNESNESTILFGSVTRNSLRYNSGNKLFSCYSSGQQPVSIYKKQVSTGVETVGVAEDGETMFFTLQGVRVENPQQGLYIKVQNGKASKVLVK